MSQQSTPPATGPAVIFETVAPLSSPPSLPAPPALAVQEFGPSGQVDVGAEPRVRFNQQVAPLGQAMLAQPGVRIVLAPKVKGRTRWRTSELLVFEPEQLARAQRYQVRVEVLPSASAALKGLFAEHPLAFSFETPGPGIAASYPDKDAPLDDWTRRQAVLLKLTQPVAVAELRKVLSARTLGDEAGSIAVRVDGVSPRELKRWTRASDWLEDHESLKSRLFQVRPVTAWPIDREIAIEVAAGLVGRLGPVPSAAPWRLSWKTPGPLRIESLHGEEGFCADSRFVLSLSERISRSQLSRIHIAPRPPKTVVEVTDDWENQGGREVEIRGAFVPARTYTVRVDAQLRDVNGYTVGEGTSGQPWTSTIALAGEPSVKLSGEGIFPIATPPVFGVTTRWVQTLRVRAAVLDPARAARALFAMGGKKPMRTFEELGVPTQDIVLRDYSLPVKAPTYWSDLAIDLRDLVGDVRGTVLVEAAPLALVPAPKHAAPLKTPASQQALLRRTDLGPVAFQSLTRSLLKVIRLSDGRPVAGAAVTRLGESEQVLLGHTDDQGLLVLPWQAEHLPPDHVPWVVSDPATHDHALVPPASVYRTGKHDDKGGLLHKGENLMLTITTDRDAYRPEESIALVGFALVDTPFARSGLRLLPEGTPVVLRVFDINEKTVVEQSLGVDGQGKFWTRLPIAKGTHLGSLHITALVQGATANAYVKLEDFRTPEFEVSARPERDSILIGEHVPMRVRANHYSGVPVTFGEVAYSSRCRVSSYAVPGLDSGWVAGDSDVKIRSTRSPRAVVAEAKGASGSVEFTPTLETADGKSLLCSVETEVTDASQQSIGAESSVRIHPASFYLAVRPPYGVFVGDPVSIPVRALTIDGQRRGAGGVEVKVTRTWREESHVKVDGRERTRWVDRKEVVAKCRLEASVDKDTVCRVERLQKGGYAIEASAKDGSRTATTRAKFSAWDKPKHLSHNRAAKIDDGIAKHLELEVRRVVGRVDGKAREDSFLSPGDHVSVTVHSPCPSGGGIALLERAGIREQHDFLLADHGAALDFAVDDTWTPQVELEVLTVCKIGGDHPKIEQASQHIAVSSAHRELKVAVLVPAHARPAQTIPISVEVTGDDNKPAKAGHVALWAVDEAVLSLGNYRVKSPLEHFLPHRGSETATTHEFSSLLHAYSPAADDPLLDVGGCGHGGLGLLGSGYGGGSAGYGGSSRGNLALPEPARARFETTPIFLGELPLDDAGKAHMDGRLPDNLTTFRVTAMASAPLADGVTPGRFGVGEASVVVSSPFILRPSLPRQMRPGDTAEIAAILQNQSGESGRVVVEASLEKKAKALTLLGVTTAEANLAAGAQLRVPFRILALRAGTADVELRARFVPQSGEALSDAVRLPVPVAVEPSLIEHTAHYGTLDSAAPVVVAARFPAAVAPGVGGISVSLSTSLLGEVQDAFQYLLDYPYGCIEQTSSRVLSLVAAHELGQRFGLAGAEAARRVGIERMLAMQTTSGGFAYWPGEEKVHPYATAFATWVLFLAKQSGAAVSAPALEHALDYLAGWVEKGGTARASDLPWATASLFPSERAIALQVLAEAGRPLPKAALDEAVAGRAGLPSFARSLLLDALFRAGDARASVMVGELLSSMSELPASAHVRESARSEWDYLFHSQNRSDAMALRVLMQIHPEHPLVAKLARGLLEARHGGRWRNTQENAYALLAVLEYARRFEAERPNFSARAWVGNRPVLEATLNASSPSTSSLVPTAELLPLPQPVSVVLQRQGEGRLYYRLGTEWQELGETQPPRDQGLAIERKVRLRRGDASDAIPVGEAVAFDLTLRNRIPLSYVAIEVPVPAGLEPVLDNLGKGHGASLLASEGDQLTSHEERHPDRVLLFFDQLSAGEHRHTVQLRAVTPGEFALPPARAEAMYMPEIYGRSTGARLTVSSAPR